ncbi:MAG: 3-phosphoshikimate 1-carboxyvinyltransferase [Candidatus Aerophobetes bacterium]|nr:3-phosphoshikimate 1-carboxyvinyltransferase [Candidatus Aerophobetes bacterium]
MEKSFIFVRSARCLKGEITLPGDKSISHRALILSSIAQGKSVIKGLQKGRDCLATLNNLKLMGIEIEEREDGIVVWGRGLSGLKEPEDILNCENSGTTMRLLSGLLAGRDFYSVLSGDKYLQKRPMRRVTEPLRRMGAFIFGRENGQFPPLTIVGRRLKGIDYFSPIPSAQVKSCLLLAGLNAKGKTVVREPYLSRDHTERMLKFLGVKIKVGNLRVSLEGGAQFSGRDIVVPGDISAASLFIGGAAILKGSKVKILNVGLNPTRRGFINVLLKMGADIRVANLKRVYEEEVGDLEVRGKNELKGITIDGEMIPRLIDEIPILAVVGCFVQGETVIKDAQELRVKETDRIKAVVKELRKLGADIEEEDDGMIIKGKKGLKGAECKSWGDHRMGMALAVAGLAAEGGVRISDVECIATSFPDFWEILNSVVEY